MALILETSERGTDRRLNLLLAASFLTAVIVIIGSLVAGPKILTSASTTNAIRRGNELTACRAGYRVELDDASSRLQAARARLDGLTNEGLEASVRRDSTALAGIVPKLAPARADVVEEAARLEQATDRYRELVELSRTDPAEFLAGCREESS